MAFFKFEGQLIAYTEFGGGPAALTPRGGRGRTAKSAPANGRPLILLHGLLLSQEMHRPLAEDLAARGNRVITLDLLGHGHSDRPRDMWRYSMATYGEQVVGLMDHLGIEQAVVMGTSLGANAALEVAAHNPERLRGLVIEMPVLDNGLLASALTFTPILVALTFGEPVMKLVARGARAIPRRLLPLYGNVLLDTIRQDPGPGAAVLQGLFFGRVAPHRPAAAPAMQYSGARKQELQVIVELGHRADGRARGAHRIDLIDRDGRWNVLDAIDLGLVHAVEKLARIGRESLDIAALALGINGIEGERALAGAGKPGEDHQLVARQVEIDIFEVMLARAADGNRPRVRSAAARAAAFSVGTVEQIVHSLIPLVPAEAGTRTLGELSRGHVDSRLRGNERRKRPPVPSGRIIRT